MAKKKINKITLNLEDLEDFMWMSYRYCIGRHTISSNFHAGTIAKYVDHLTDERKAFMATDIRREISEILLYKSNFHVNGFSETLDAVSIWLNWIKTNGFTVNDEFMNNKKFTIDTVNPAVYVDDIELGDKRTDYTYTSIYMDIHDVLYWIKLANYLDIKTHKTIIIEGQEYEAFPYYSFDQGIVDKLWITCDKYKSSPLTNTYIAPDALKFKE